MKLKYLPFLLLITTTALADEFTNSDKPVLAKTNAVTLRIEANPTTGYRWYLKSYDANLIKPVSDRYIAPKQPMPGKGGTEVWQFQLTSSAMLVPHIINVTLEYRRAWEMDSGLTRTFQIVTK